MAESETGLTLTAQLKLMLSSEAYHYCADCHSHCRQTSLAVAAAKEAVKAHVSDAQQLVELLDVIDNADYGLDAKTSSEEVGRSPQPLTSREGDGMSTDDSKHYYCDEGTDEDPTPVHRCNQNEPTNHPAPVILDEAALEEIDLIRETDGILANKIGVLFSTDHERRLIDLLSRLRIKVTKLQAEIAEYEQTDLVPRSRYNAADNDWREARQQFQDLAKRATTEIERLESANTALRKQLAARTIELERESHEMQKWNNRANQLAIEGQELHRRLAQVEKERDHYKRLYEI